MSETTTAPAATAPTTPTAAPATPPATAPAATEPPKPAETPKPDARALAEEASARKAADRAARERDALQKRLDEQVAAAQRRGELLSKDPWAALEAAFPGKTKADITKALLASRQKPDPQAQVTSEVAELKKKLEAMEAEATQHRTTQRETAVYTHCLTTAEKGGDKYALIAAEMKRDPAHYRRALIAYEQAHPEVSGPDAALADFEAALLQRAQLYASIPKVRALLGGSVSESDKKPVTESQAGPKASTGGPKTLTKDLASERASPAVSGRSTRDVEEANRRKAAIAALEASRKG